MSVARIMALSGIGVAVIFLTIITIQYLISKRKNKGNYIDERGEGNKDSRYDDKDVLSSLSQDEKE